MFGPPSLISDAVNSVLRLSARNIDRQMCLLRIETAHYAPPSMQNAVAEAFLLEYCAREAGLTSADAFIDDITPEQALHLDASIASMRALMRLAKLEFPT